MKKINLSKNLTYCSSISLLIFIFLGMSLLIPRKWGESWQNDCKFRVCVARYGIHTMFVIPVQNKIFDWQKYLPLKNAEQAYRYLGFGWGERNWYINPPTQLSDKIRDGFRALFFENPSALGVQKHYTFPEADRMKCIGVSSPNYLNLMDFIKNSFQKDELGNVIQIVDRPDFQVSFYEAQGSYSILNNSTSWTAQGLRVANINTPLWAGFAEAIMLHLPCNCLKSIATG
ncbi:MAG: DUF2459 domain-containing protein [Hydrococcus sp. Prado102]|jgi:uncharacterized protein (TIGR02117 family)|nr:DUF2459 domain-containing protein [Hydrococcus sp. Prado102]